ncbi:hypothetical protein RchiOBHm_Chr1g0365371 [Rosa chinensis]|uniref:Uncharacterized protein n=1 Tax=Rosa chinensis TaxID=74649 RepID=A0A2P6SJZ1_ROSCH|nr:hypothetical protein RchiOBHm_Chr1g0365371 [Rosa chinensis]
MNQNLYYVGRENFNATFTSAMCHMLPVFAFVTTPPWVLTRFIRTFRPVSQVNHHMSGNQCSRR